MIVYKVDRLSRSLLDFSRLVEAFEKHRVSFVSVTQQFNTATSMGRLVLNVLLSFAQFEREIIGERIRDKIAATRRKGKWAGGYPILGYDVDRSNVSPKLIVNAREAARVRDIYHLYLSLGSLLPVVNELTRRDWRNKDWNTKKGNAKGGRPFDKGTLYALLTNLLYIGRSGTRPTSIRGSTSRSSRRRCSTRFKPRCSITAARAALPCGIDMALAQGAAVLQGVQPSDGPQFHEQRREAVSILHLHEGN